MQPPEVIQQVSTYKQGLHIGASQSPQAARVEQTVPASFYGAAILGPSFHISQFESTEPISLNSPPNPFISLPIDPNPPPVSQL